MTKNIHGRIAITLALAALAPMNAFAQSAYPVKPIRVIVPYPAGGTSDILTRLTGAKIAESWGQQVIADNRAGANGNIAAELLARAAPDGYTLMLAELGNLVISSILYTKLPFEVPRDFAPVAMVSYSPHLLTVHPSVPAKTVRELIALAKARPGKLNFPTGLGGAPHLAGMMFAQRTGIDWVYIPTKGGPQSTLAVTSGDGDALFLGILQVLPQVQAGKLKLIAVSSEQRLPTLPDTPTVAETLPGFFTGTWQGVLAPAKLPAEIAAKLNAEMARVLKLPDVLNTLTSQGTTPIFMSPAEMGSWLVAEKERWGKVVRDGGFRLEP